MRPLAKSFWRRALHPFLPEPAVLRPALRARAGRNAGKLQKGRCRPPRGLALKARRGFAGTVNATAKPAAAVDLSHQTLAVRHGARPFAFRRSLPALPVSAVGLDDPACREAGGGHVPEVCSYFECVFSDSARAGAGLTPEGLACHAEKIRDSYELSQA